MTTNRHPSSFLPRWLFWLESLLLVTITALLTFLVLKDDPVLPFVLYGIGVVAPPSLVGFGTVLFLALRTRQIKKSFYVGASIVLTGEFIAIFVNTLLVNPIWNAQRPPCQIQCGNSATIGSLEIFWPILCMFPGIAAAGVASFLGWIVLRLQKGQASQITVEKR
jgi:hypothetical protein